MKERNKKKVVPSTEILFAIRSITYQALADSGTSSTLANKEVSKAGVKIGKSKAVKWSTQAGKFETSKSFRLEGATLPQFTTNRTFNCVVHRFDKQDNDPYGMILGQDVMGQLGLDLCFGTGEFRWGNLGSPWFRVATGNRRTLKRRAW